jgi:ABC-2 type transport system ATP-binding protein
MPVVTVRNLVKDYGSARAVDGVSFTIEAGEVYGLLGENGAGKSTTVEILEGHRRRTAGELSVLGEDPDVASRSLRDRIGIVLQTSGVEPVLTVGELVDLYGGCYRRRRPVDECLQLVGLADSAGKRVAELSGGQQRRLDLALGIVGCPELLFLDEPTTGFDPAARRNAWELIRTLAADGTTVLLTSHYLDEVEQLADRVGVLNRGRLVAEGTPASLAGAIGATTIRFQIPGGATVGDVAALVSAPVSELDGGVELATDRPTEALHAITAWALERGLELVGLTVTRPSLEDMFLSLTADGAAGD